MAKKLKQEDFFETSKNVENKRKNDFLNKSNNKGKKIKKSKM